MLPPGDPELASQAFELMKELVSITGEKWVGASRFASLAERFGASEIRQRIVFLSGVRGLMRDIPVDVFHDPDARQSILNAAQEALDLAIELEEEE